MFHYRKCPQAVSPPADGLHEDAIFVATAFHWFATTEVSWQKMRLLSICSYSPGFAEGDFSVFVKGHLGIIGVIFV